MSKSCPLDIILFSSFKSLRKRLIVKQINIKNACLRLHLNIDQDRDEQCNLWEQFPEDLHVVVNSLVKTNVMIIRERHYFAFTSILVHCAIIEDIQLHQVLHEKNELCVVDRNIPVCLTRSFLIH